MNNDYAFNSAVAGTKANLKVSIGARKQWFGFEGSPGIQNVTFQGRVAKNIGLGAQIFNDTWGLSRRTGLNLGVNYILELNDQMDISMGISMMLNQFSINRDKVVTEIPDDIAVYDGLQNQLFPDVGFSAYLNSEIFYVGLNATHLLELKNDLSNSIKSGNYLSRTAYLIGGADVEAAEDIVVSPSLLGGYTFGATYQLQADVKVEYAKLFWVGAGYRLGDAIIAHAGGYIKNFTVGYSFDYTISSLNGNVGAGSHELYVAFDIIKNDRKSSWFKRNRIYNQNRR